MMRSRLSSLTVLSFALAAFVAPVAGASGKPLLRLRAFAKARLRCTCIVSCNALA